MAAPALLLNAPVGPSARLRVWQADPERPIAYRPGAHAGVEIAWCDRGSLHYAIGKNEVALEAGGAVVVGEGVEHGTTFDGPFHGAAIEVEASTIAELGDALGRGAGLVSGRLGDDASTRTLGNLLARELTNNEAGALLAADALLEAMLVRVLRGAPSAERAPLDPSIARAVKRIEASYAEDLGVVALAREANMSRFHFSRRFREVTGRSPYRYLCDVRLERAAEMLRRGRHGVTEVALSVGCADPGRFARMFRARFGTTPSRFAEEQRARTAFSKGAPL